MRYALGIDVGGTTIKSALCDQNGKLKYQKTTPTPLGGDALVETITELIKTYDQEIISLKTSDNNSLNPKDIVSTVGVAIPGVVDEESGIGVLSVNLGWENYPFQERLISATGHPIALGHDVRSGALAESIWGEAGPNSVFLAIGTGIAAGVILNGVARVGAGWAGEIGQNIIADPFNPSQRQPVEKIASAESIARRFLERTAYETINGAKQVFDLAHSGNSVAKQVIDEACEALADTVVASVALLGQVRIVIGGGLANAGPDLINPLRQKVRARIGVLPEPEIIGAKLGSWAQTRGIAWSAFQVDIAEGKES
ncbi:ROK family protein [Actinomycetaceae bacterium TAE3-ERU4]|nr:ROK family protein [Actinomycetaceae bacterium TAE3-ERU4]